MVDCRKKHDRDTVKITPLSYIHHHNLVGKTETDERKKGPWYSGEKTPSSSRYHVRKKKGKLLEEREKTENKNRNDRFRKMKS